LTDVGSTYRQAHLSVGGVSYKLRPMLAAAAATVRADDEVMLKMMAKLQVDELRSNNC